MSLQQDQSEQKHEQSKTRIVHTIEIKKKTPLEPRRHFPLQPVCKYEIERLILKSMINDGDRAAANSTSNLNSLLGKSLRDILSTSEANEAEEKDEESANLTKDQKNRLVCTFAAKELYENFVKMQKLANSNYLDRPSPYKAHLAAKK